MFNWASLGKKRSTLGKWLDKHKIQQSTLASKSGVGINNIGKMCSENLPKNKITKRTAQKVIKALRDLTGEELEIEDFWT